MNIRRRELNMMQDDAERVPRHLSLWLALKFGFLQSSNNDKGDPVSEALEK